jgi:hypothetical protein
MRKIMDKGMFVETGAKPTSSECPTQRCISTVLAIFGIGGMIMIAGRGGGTENRAPFILGGGGHFIFLPSRDDSRAAEKNQSNFSVLIINF